MLSVFVEVGKRKAEVSYWFMGIILSTNCENRRLFRLSSLIIICG